VTGGTYLIYVVRGAAELEQQGTTLVSPPGTTATIRMAKLKDPGQEAVLDAHAQAFPTGLDMRYNVAGDVATVTWKWDVDGNAADLLILSWAHHRTSLQGPNFVNIEYLTLKGPMRGIRGDTWTLRYDLPTITWQAKEPIHSSCAQVLELTLEQDINALTPDIPGDFYFWGGSFGRTARLALIADQLGRQDLVGRVVGVLKQSVEPWFDPEHVPAGKD
jgi:endo-1,3(4)-beta-glucanase